MINVWERIDYLHKGWVIVRSLQTFPLFCIYLILILLSSYWQRYTKPVNLRPILIVYNLACSIVSVYSLVAFIYGLYLADGIYSKQNSEALRPVFELYWYTKIYELLDTVFMILRHKRRQITFLHVFHHSTMLVLSDICVHMFPWPAIAPPMLLNSFVHVVLYLYYGLTALFPENPPEWKKQVTQLQIMQFFIGFIHAGYGYAYHGFCVYGIFYGIMMTWLFSNFYYNAYLKKRKVNKKQE